MLNHHPHHNHHCEYESRVGETGSGLSTAGHLAFTPCHHDDDDYDDDDDIDDDDDDDGDDDHTIGAICLFLSVCDKRTYGDW